jgi:hypothetical protein
MLFSRLIGTILSVLSFVSVEGFQVSMRPMSISSTHYLLLSTSKTTITKSSTPKVSTTKTKRSRRPFQSSLQRMSRSEEVEDASNHEPTVHSTLSERRRSLLRSPFTSVMMTTTAAIMTAIPTDPSMAFVGSLPEWQNTNIILQGVTLRVTDPSQRQQMISFLQEGFDMQILRQSPDGLDTVRSTQEVLLSALLDMHAFSSFS